jgi:hypothetical protein
MLEDDGMDDALLGFDIDAAMDSRQQQQQQTTQAQTQQQPWQSPFAGLPAAAPAAVVMMTAMQVTAPTFVAIPAAKAAQQQQQQQQQLVPPSGGMSQDAKARAETNRAAALAKQAMRKKARPSPHSHTVSAGPGLAHLGAMQPLPTLPQVLPVQYPQPQQPLKPLAPPQQQLGSPLSDGGPSLAAAPGTRAMSLPRFCGEWSPVVYVAGDMITKSQSLPFAGSGHPHPHHLAVA